MNTLCVGQSRIFCRGKPQHKQPTVVASPPPLGVRCGLGHSGRHMNKLLGGKVAQYKSGQGYSANFSISPQPNWRFKGASLLRSAAP